MSKLARALTLAATLAAAVSLTSMPAVAQAHTSNVVASTRHRALGRVEFHATGDHPASSQQETAADATVRRLLARERSAVPNADQPRLLLDEERSTLLNLSNRAPAQTAAATPAALAEERYYSTWGYGDASTPAPAEPSGQPTWLVIALAVLAAVLGLVAGGTVLAAHRATPGQHAGQTA